MNARILRLVLAFLAGFVLLSFLPLVPGLLGGVNLSGSADELGDVLLTAALALSVTLLVVVMRRRMRRARRAPAATAAKRVATRPSHALATRTRAAGPRAMTINQGPLSPLTQKIRAGSQSGERIPAIARRHSLAVDAVRVALDRGPSSPAARPGSSFRSRQASVPAPTRTKALSGRRNPYAALA
jgi:hypothetical protein